MGKLVYNERSWAIDLISEINKWCSTRNIVINRAGGESTLKKDKKRFFQMYYYTVMKEVD